MSVARGFKQKTQLEPHEKLSCAYLYLVRGISQHDLTAIYNVNQGRVNDAIKDVMRAVKWQNGELHDE